MLNPWTNAELSTKIIHPHPLPPGQPPSPEFAVAARHAAVLGRRALRRRDGGGRAAGGAWADAAAPAVATLAGAKGRGGVGFGDG